MQSEPVDGMNPDEENKHVCRGCGRVAVPIVYDHARGVTVECVTCGETETYGTY